MCKQKLKNTLFSNLSSLVRSTVVKSSGLEEIMLVLGSERIPRPRRMRMEKRASMRNVKACVVNEDLRGWGRRCFGFFTILDWIVLFLSTSFQETVENLMKPKEKTLHWKHAFEYGKLSYE